MSLFQAGIKASRFSSRSQYLIATLFDSRVSLVSKRLVSGSIIAQKGPFEVALVEGKRYSWCQCGHSNKQPFCDGQHRRKASKISPVRFKAEETGPAFLCGCKQTKNPPYCDGTHMCDEVQNSS